MNGEDIRSAAGKNGVALPPDFPADVAIYPKATPHMVATKDKETTVILTTTDPVQKVVAFYKGQLKEKRWTMRLSSETPQVSMLQGEKDGRTLAVFITETPQETSIQLAVVKEK